MSSKVVSPLRMLLKMCSGPLKPTNFIGAVLPLQKYIKLLKSTGSLDSRILANPLRK